MNPHNPPAFGGEAFAFDWAPANSTPTPLARDLFAESKVGFIDQTPTNRCGGLAAYTAAIMFAKLRGIDPGDLDDLFVYEGAMRQDRGIGWNRQDLGLASPRSAIQTLYFRGICRRGISEVTISPAHPWHGTPGFVSEPTDAAITDAATRKVTKFDRLVTGDLVGATCTAIANALPVMIALRVDERFWNVSGDIETHAAQFGPSMVPNARQHYVVAGAFNAATRTIDVSSNMGGAPVVRLPWDYFGANVIDGYVIREFMGLGSEVSPFNIVQAYETRSAEVMKALRYYMHNVIRDDYAEAGRIIPRAEKPAIVRAHMAAFGVTADELGAACAPWFSGHGAALVAVRQFLSME